MAKKSTLLQVLKKVKDKGVKSLTPVQWETFLASNTEPNEIDEKIKQLEGYEEKSAAYDATGDLIPESNQAMIDRFRKKTGRGEGRTSSKVDPNKFLGKESSTPADETSSGGALVKIAGTVEDIKSIVKSDQKFTEKKATDDRKEKEQKKRGLKEKLVEGMGKGVKAIANGAKKILAPVENIFSKLMGWIGKYLFASAVMKFVDWMGKGENAKKIQSIFKFLGDWWPAILAGLMAFFPAVLGPLGLIAGTVLLVTVFLPKVIDTVKMLFGFGPKVDKEIQKGEKGLNKLEKNEGKGLNLEDENANSIKTDTKKQPDELSGVDQKASNLQQPTETQRMNKGGQVPGSGNKDTVPAMLTPGEFVMSKDAVQEYGVNTLAGMNAAAGGTNKPTMKGGRSGYSGGGPVGDRSHFGTTGYRMGQTLPEQFYYSKETLTSSYKEKDGKVLEDKTELTELSGAIGMPDLIEHQKQLVESIRKVEGYEDINFMDVVQYPSGRGRLVGMPEEKLYPIFNASDAWKASDAKRDEAIRIDMEAGTTNLNPTETAKAVGLNAGINLSTQQSKPAGSTPPPPPSGGSGGGIIPIPIPTGGGNSGGGTPDEGSSVPSFSVVSGGGVAKEHTLGIRR